jgi:hypothetical protein
MSIHSVAGSAGSNSLHARFLGIVPIIERHGEVYFRFEKCRERRADRIAEMVGLAWKWFVRLAHRGKDATRFPTVLASFAARAVKCGRRVAGMTRAADVLNEICQQRRGFAVESLPVSTSTTHENLYAAVNGQRSLDAFEERLQDNTQTPVPEQVAFRLDFPAWLTTRTERDRRIIEQMARNERTKDLARQFGISPARISQLRRAYQDDWTRFADASPKPGQA